MATHAGRRLFATLGAVVALAVAQGATSSAGATTVAASTASQVRLSVPQSMVVHTNAPAGARVSFAATARDTISGALPISCTARSGALFPLGATTVTCSAANARGVKAVASFRVLVDVRGGRLASPLVAGGLVQKGDQVHASFGLYAADGVTPISDVFAPALLASGVVAVHTQQVGSSTATTQPVTYNAMTHRFAATVQTFAWVGGTNYRVWYTVTTAKGSLIAGRAAVVGVRLGA